MNLCTATVVGTNSIAAKHGELWLRVDRDVGTLQVVDDIFMATKFEDSNEAVRCVQQLKEQTGAEWYTDIARTAIRRIAEKAKQ